MEIEAFKRAKERKRKRERERVVTNMIGRTEWNKCNLF